MTWKRHSTDNSYKVQVFIVNMANINKTLRVKKHSDFQKKLFKYFHHHLQIFSYKAIDQLPSLCDNSADHKIKLILNDNNKAFNILYSFLYQMSRKELLIL